MSRSLSARCIHRTVFPLPPSPSQPAPRRPPGARQYSYAALKTRPQPDRNYPTRQENPPPYSRAVPHEPGIRLHQDYSRGQSQAPRERQPPPSDREPRRLYGEEGSHSSSTRERGRRVDVGARDLEQQREESSSEAGMTDHRRAGRSAGEQLTRRGGSDSSPLERRPPGPDQIFSEHLNGLFSPLKFPLELSARILTHASHPAAMHGHNAQFSFIGRRVLESYLLMLLASSPHLKPSHDLQEIVSRVLNTYFLGDHIGTKWGMGRVMRWTPTIATSMLNDEARDKTKLLKDVGLYKVQGDAVAAVMGGIFQQFGGSIAHRVFHTRVLPRLLLPAGGLPLCFHADALEACTRLGGAQGDLVLDSDAPARQEQKREALASPIPNRQTLQH